MKEFALMCALLYPLATFGYLETPYRCDEYANATDEDQLRKKAECQCAAPNMSFFMEKLKESFQATEAEQLLKEIVTEPQNYPQREELKSLYRSLHSARILTRPALKEKMAGVFDKIIDGSKLHQGIPDFPTRGKKAELMSIENSLALKLSSFEPEAINFLPPDTVAKISPVITIRYFYPLDRYAYFVNYDKQELPVEKALTKIQADFESACYNRFWENVGIRKSNANERSKTGTSRQ